MSELPANHTEVPGAQAVRLYLCRHGEPERRDLFYGHYDIALSSRGRAQARDQAELLADSSIVAVYSSDLQRARYGADAVAQRHDILPTLDEALREMHLGRLENVPYDDARNRYPEVAGRSYRDMLDFRMPDGGESVRDVAERVLPVVEAAILRHASTDRPGVVIYAHNTVTRLLLGQAAGLGPAGYGVFAQGYAAVSRVDVPVEHAQVQWPGASVVYCNRDTRWSRGR